MFSEKISIDRTGAGIHAYCLKIPQTIELKSRSHHFLSTIDYNMSANVFVNALFLVMVNVIFMIAGAVLNLTVLIIFWRSSQLRKQLCYFMILVLSCFDLAVVAISHPLQIYSIILFYHIKNTEVQERIKNDIIVLLNGLSVQALFLLTIERYLALLYPFFHQQSVTRKKLLLVLAILCLSHSGTILFPFLVKDKICYLLMLIRLSFFLLSLTYFNYKMFRVAKSKRINRASLSSTHQEPRPSTLSRKFSTCAFAVICYFVCSCPSLAFRILRLSDINFLDREVALFHLWTITCFLMNSTLNCLIFFWRNSILRRETMALLRCCRITRVTPDSLN